MPIYVNFLLNGQQFIKGDVTEENHLHWVEGSTVRFNLTHQSDDDQSGDQSKNHSTGNLVLTKAADSASQQLMMASHDGTLLNVVVHLASTIDRKALVKMAYSLIDVVLQFSLQTDAQMPQETVTIDFAKVTADDGGHGPDISSEVQLDNAQWDLTPNTTPN